MEIQVYRCELHQIYMIFIIVLFSKKESRYDEEHREIFILMISDISMIFFREIEK